MLFNTNATIRYRKGLLNARLVFEQGLFLLNIDGYLLETDIAFNSHWEISEESFNESGNKYGFDLVGKDPHEITNFELEFLFPSFLIKNDAHHETELTVLIKYEGRGQEIGLFDREKHIAVYAQEDMEGTFRKLYNQPDVSDRSLKSCFGCALSGYEKGGSALFCMKKRKTEFLSKPYLEHYQNFFAGLEREVVSEFYHCDEFIASAHKK